MPGYSSSEIEAVRFLVTHENGEQKLVLEKVNGSLVYFTPSGSGGPGGANVTIDSDGTLIVDGVTVQLGTDAEISAAIAASAASSQAASIQRVNHTGVQAIGTVSGLQDALNAKAADTSVVKLTTDQTIAGIKTFSVAPVVPDGAFAIGKVASLQSALDVKAYDADVVKLLGAQTIAGVKTHSSRLVAQAGVEITDDDGSSVINDYRGLVLIKPSAADEEASGLVIKAPDASWGVGQDYSEGNYIVMLSDAEHRPVPSVTILRTITSTTNATPVAVGLSVAHGLTSGDVVRITGTGIPALDNKWWKITVTSTTSFTLNDSSAPGSTSTVGSVFTDRSPVLNRLATSGIGTVGMHVATGLRGNSGSAVGTYSLHVDPYADVSGLIITLAGAGSLATAPLSPFVMMYDPRNANAIRFQVTALGQTQHDAGTVGTPGISFVDDSDTGMWRSNANTIDFTVGGVNTARISSTILNVNPGLATQSYIGNLFGSPGLYMGFTDPAMIYRSAAHIATIWKALSLDSTVDGSSFLQIKEQTTEPTAPAADHVRLFAQDNGAGKTRLVAKFPTGANVILATQA